MSDRTKKVDVDSPVLSVNTPLIGNFKSIWRSWPIRYLALVITFFTCIAASNGSPLSSCLPSGVQAIYKDNSADYNTNANGQAIFRQRSPAAIIFPISATQISQAVKCAITNGIVPVARSGGHSYEALSSLDNCLVVDLSKMSTVKFIKDGTVNAPAGIRLGNLYTQLYDKNPTWSFPAGVCPSVGLGGHVAAGGYGSLGRNHGLAADKVTSATIVLANGTIVTANMKQNSDLFYAIRGGGGSSFGIVVDMDLEIAKVPFHYVAKVNYPKIEESAKIVKTWYTWIQGPLQSRKVSLTGTGKVFDGRNVNMQLNLYKTSLQLVVHYSPPEARSEDELNNILIQAGMVGAKAGFTWKWDTKPTKVSTLVAQSFASGKGTLKEAEARKIVSVPQIHLDVSWKDRSRLKSEYVSGPLQNDFYAALQDIIIKARTQLHSTFAMIQLEPYGGMISEKDDNFSAFPHRKVQFVIQYGLYFKKQLPDPEIPAGLSWINYAQRKFKPYVNGQHYQGYVDLDVNPASFYGANFDKLTSIKQKYDPNNEFWSDLIKPKQKGATWFTTG